jgi:hypothetical protein
VIESRWTYEKRFTDMGFCRRDTAVLCRAASEGIGTCQVALLESKDEWIGSQWRFPNDELARFTHLSSGLVLSLVNQGRNFGPWRN